MTQEDLNAFAGRCREADAQHAAWAEEDALDDADWAEEDALDDELAVYEANCREAEAELDALGLV